MATRIQHRIQIFEQFLKSILVTKETFPWNMAEVDQVFLYGH